MQRRSDSQFLKLRFQCVGPNLIASRAEVQLVRHDLSTDRAVRFQKLIADFQVLDTIAVSVTLNHLVDGNVVQSLRIELIRAARENAMQNDFGVGQSCFQDFQDAANSLGDFAGVLIKVPRVVGTDHQYGNFRFDFAQVAMGQPPDHMLGSIATDTQIDGLAVSVVLVPDVFTATFPALRD